MGTLSVLSMSRHLCILAVLALAAFAAPAHDEHELIEVDNIVPESDLMDASAIQEQFLTIKSMISQGKTKEMLMLSEKASKKSTKEASHGRPVLLYSQPRIRISPKFGSCRAPSVATRKRLE